MATVRWSIIALAVCLVCCVDETLAEKAKKKQSSTFDIGVRAMPAEDSPAMAKFKRGLGVADRTLLAKMKSKTRYIEALLGSKKVMDKRDQMDTSSAVLHTRSTDDKQCCNCNAGSEGCFLPTDVKRSRVIRCCIPVASSKRDQVDEVLSKLSNADKELIEKHKSKLQNLVEAAEQPARNDESKRSKVDKKQQESQAELIQKLREGLTDLEKKLDELSPHESSADSEGAVLDEMSEKFVSDVNLAKEKGIKLDDLLAALKKRAVKTPVN